MRRARLQYHNQQSTPIASGSRKTRVTYGTGFRDRHASVAEGTSCREGERESSMYEHFGVRTEVMLIKDECLSMRTEMQEKRHVDRDLRPI